MLHYQILVSAIHEKIERSRMETKNLEYQNQNRMKNLKYVSYFVSDIQDYLDYVIKNHVTLTDNPPIQIYINKIQNEITFKTITEYYLEI